MISQTTKQVLRDKYGNKCVKCGATEDLTVDHINPRWNGGTDDINNLQIMCRGCNLKKGTTPPVWIRVKHLFNGFFYKHIHETRMQVASANGAVNTEYKKAFQSISDQIKSYQGELKALYGKINLVEFENKGLKTSVLKLEGRLRAIEDYQGIEWVEKVITINEYQKKHDTNSGISFPDAPGQDL